MNAPPCVETLPPELLALCSAVLFALGVHCTRIGLRSTDNQTATMIQVGTATAIYWLFAPFLLESWYWTAPALLLLASIGLIRPFLSANLSVAGTRLLGPTLSSTLSGTSPLFGVALGVGFLGEALTPSVALGTALIVAGVVTLSRRQDSTIDWPLWALALPIGAAVIRSVAQLFAKIAMETIPSAYFVGLVGYSVSFAVALANHARPRLDRGPIIGPGLPWLAGTGALYGLAIFSLNSALQCGRLVVVAPLIACAPLFTLLLGALVFREREINRRVILAVALIVPGAIAVSVHG